jgi:uncharacterized membrane protein
MVQATSEAAPKPRSRPKNGGEGEAGAPNVDDLTQRNVRSIQRLDRLEQGRRGKLDRIADRISEFAGSTGFLVVHVLWFGGWIGYNAWAGADAFDPYPFTFLTMVVSLEAIFLSTFILISQTRATRISDHRNQLDLQINLLTEQENTAMLAMLERIAAKLGVDGPGDASVKAMEQPTRLEKVAQQIESGERKQRAAS